ncbi:putative Eukaryotic translation initiation factor 4E-binding protein 1 [Hypsibius exemplaris]|uniref:Eukaryotic translation initiation factor 4E-binding protein 1 n=1 Tax=Hypsibius exemplaris TaxID=2072580 RepID=A0A1W0X4E4_HYPEX|nr:putative Eukaryotic translation initiation factor 4E-binding protein 1 [Hypsibius exemplaris]
MTSVQTDRRFTEQREIPIRRIMITDASQLPSNLSQTPGGSIYGTTPGGSRVVYDRSLLLKLSCSPLTKTPPSNMKLIPGVTASPPKNPVANCKTQAAQHVSPAALAKGPDSDEQQFEMDI